MKFRSHIHPRFLHALAGGVMLFGAQALSASMVLIDFNDVGAAPTFGGIWNTLAMPSGTSALVADNGVATSLTVAFDGSWGDPISADTWTHGDTIAWIDGGAASDGFNGSTSIFSNAIVFAGATPGQLYQIDLLAARSFGDPAAGTGDYSIGGNFGAGSQGNNGNDFNVNDFGLNAGEFLSWTVSANGVGEIRLDIEGMDPGPPAPVSNIGKFASAARITCLTGGVTGQATVISCANAVPEPATMMLLGISVAGVAGAGFTRRRKRTR